MQYGIEKKCKSIVGLFGTPSDQIIPVDYDTSMMSFKLGKKSSLGVKLYSITSNMSSVDYSANDYVKTGLVALFDAKENTGYGSHSNSSATWKNLASSSLNVPDMNVIHTNWWDESCINLDGTDIFASCNFYQINGITIECCYELSTPSEGEEWNNAYCPLVIGNQNKYFSNKRRIVISPHEDYFYINTYEQELDFSVSEREHSYKLNLSPLGLRTCSTYMPSCEFSETTNKFFMNGIDFSTTSTSGEFVASTSRYANGIIVGSDAWEEEEREQDPFVGKIHCIRIYNKELSQDEVILNNTIDRARYFN